MRGISKQLLERQMTRKEFLQLSGASLLVLFGLGNFMRFLNQYRQPAKAPTKIVVKSAAHGFGASKFGV
ncbi:MAG TPA: hypothetical protein VLG40_00290 [Candidatus Saccharimonas sp.]|nr:hypothetical protein [Candidatus Saccharimonas sp.]